MEITKEQAQQLLCLANLGDTTEDWENFDLKFKLLYIGGIYPKGTQNHYLWEVLYEDIPTKRYYRSTFASGPSPDRWEIPYYFQTTVSFEEYEIEFTGDGKLRCWWKRRGPSDSSSIVNQIKESYTVLYLKEGESMKH